MLKNLFKPFRSKSDQISHIEELTAKMQDALIEWKTAQKAYDEITDPQQLDLAILKVVRAERRYMHYLKLIKQNNAVSQN
ncbi:MAG: hypothetical protein AB1420_18025 [Bacillota bacterium]